MPVHLDYISLTDMYLSTEKKILLNNMSLLDTDPEDLSKLLYTVYEDSISMIPKCECGHLKGAWQLGKTCPHCNTEVKKEFDIIKPILWFKSFREDLPFVSPFFWSQLKLLFKTVKRGKNVDNIRWLCDTGYNPPGVNTVIKSIAPLIGGRGYVNFINNIDKVLTYLAQAFKTHPNGKTKYEKLVLLKELYDKHKDKIITHYLPLINKRLFVMEVTSKGTYTVSMLSDINDIARTVIILANTDPNSRKVENGTAAVISKLAILFESYMKTKIASKRGLVRKHIYGTRSHFTLRAVYTTLSANYKMDEVHLPWSTLCSAFRPHVLNKLIKRGYSYKEADIAVNRGVLRYDPVIDEIGKELIEEAKEITGIGIPVILHRNPSLLMGSAVLLYVTKWKTNPEDRSISASINALKSSNLDSDGDELNCIILLDKEMYEKAKNFRPEYNIMSLDYFKINGFLHVNAPTVATVSNYMIDQEEQVEGDPIYKKLLDMEKKG